MKTLRRLVYAVIVIGLILTLSGYLNYSGICIPEGRRLTDEERIRYALGRIINKREIPLRTEKDLAKYYEQIPYASVEEYLKLYPDCCRVDPDEFYDLVKPSFLDRMTGYNSNDVIEVNYFVRYIDEDGQKKSQWIKLQRFQQNCGGASL